MDRAWTELNLDDIPKFGGDDDIRSSSSSTGGGSKPPAAALQYQHQRVERLVDKYKALQVEYATYTPSTLHPSFHPPPLFPPSLSPLTHTLPSY